MLNKGPGVGYEDKNTNDGCTDKGKTNYVSISFLKHDKELESNSLYCNMPYKWFYFLIIGRFAKFGRLKEHISRIF